MSQERSELGSQTEGKTVSVQISVTSDLSQTKLTPEQIEQLTDDDLTRIGKMVEEHFSSDALWDEIRYAAETILEEREET